MDVLFPTTVVACALPPPGQADFAAALDALALPHWRAAWLQAQHHSWAVPTESLTPACEKAHAQALGWDCDDGCVPWAAQAAAQRGLDPQLGWAWIHLCHWHVGNGQVSLGDAGVISAAESDALLQVMQPYFEEDGIALHPHQPGVWLAQSPHWLDLPTASLTRVMGRDVNPWLVGAQGQAPHPAVQLVRRLQNEMQMLLYTHAVNAQRARPINSFWLCGTGRWPPRLATGPACAASPMGAPDVLYVDSLRLSYMAQDAQAWAQAWAALDVQVLAQRLTLPGHRLVLCDDDRAQVWHNAPLSLRQRWQRWWGPRTWSQVLA